MKNKNGFTLVELLAVLVVLAIILSIAVPGITGIIKSSTRSSFNSDAKMVLKGIEYKKLENEKFNPQEITKENMMETIGLNSDNYKQVNIAVKDELIELILVGQNKWEGFTAYGSMKNMRVVESKDYDVVPPSITILGDNPVEVGKGSTYTDAGATAADLKDGDVPISSVVIRNASNVVVESIDTSTFTTYTITYTAVDSQGNMATSVRRVNIVDKTAPVITILGDNPTTINVNSVYSDAGATAIDETDGDVTSKIVVTGTVNPSILGTYTITYTVKDVAGNQAVATRTVNVIDNVIPTVVFGTNGSGYVQNINPTVTVNDNVAINTSSLKYQWTTSTTAPTEASFSTSFTNGGTINTPAGVTGGYYLWILAKDTSNNMVISRSNIFNLDNTKPVITLNGSSPVTVNKGSTYSDLGATATDAHSGVAGSVTATGTVNTSIVGTYTITYNVNDNAGNAATPVTRTVNVIDVAAPVITILGDNPVSINLGGTYTDAGATAIDDVDGDVTSKIVVTGTVNPSIIGTYTITYTVKDNANNQAVATRTVNVLDNVIPTVAFGTNGNATYAKSRSTTVTVSDNVAVNASSLKYQWTTSTTAPTEASFTTTFTNGGTINTPAGVTGGYYLWILAKDTNNNSAVIKSNVFNLDNTKPVINLNGSNPVTIAIGSTYTDAGATASDNIDGNLTSSIVTTGLVNPSTAGTYTITYNVSDSSGNSATTVTRTVNVLQVTYNYAYTGNYQTFTAPVSGVYQIELWGAEGGNHAGKGAYTSGRLSLSAGTSLYVYVGQGGQEGGVPYTSVNSNGWNGGGNGGYFTYSGWPCRMAGGGGATDVRLSAGVWNDTTGLRSRIMVAAGAGGGSGSILGGSGGTLTGYGGTAGTSGSASAGGGGTQTTGGSSAGYAGGFGFGGDGYISYPSAPNNNDAFGGGGGYYGGGGGYGGYPTGVSSGSMGGGGGGSSFVSGCSGCNAVNASGTSTGLPTHYSGYVFTNISMLAGNASMPAPTGGNETGHTGDGYARITFISQ